jgi:hypothetical protein
MGIVHRSNINMLVNNVAFLMEKSRPAWRRGGVTVTVTVTVTGYLF